MTLILACGYKRSGKDTLYSYLQRNSTELWDVYCRPGMGAKYLELFQPMDKCETSSAVIKEFHDQSGITVTESNKELYRPQLIELAERKKLDDKYYWIRKCLGDIPQSRYISGVGDIPQSRYISGFRFPLEYEFATSVHSNVLTVRIFRKEVPIPTEPQEHQLDDFVTDFLFVGKDTDIGDVIDIFPQYIGHRRII